VLDTRAARAHNDESLPTKGVGEGRSLGMVPKGVPTMKETSEIELTFEEDVDHTNAQASIVIRGATFTGSGRARRNPVDANLPMIGEELATARALSDLAHKLVEAATEAISEREGRPVQLQD